MIITVDDIRAVRPIAHNIDNSRVEVYIREAEVLDVVPAISAELYEVLDAGEELAPEQEMLLNGGYYDAGCGRRKFEGLKVAAAYLAYARFMRNNQTNVTPYGIVTKIGEESATTERSIVVAQASEAQNIGQAMLAEAVRYWQTVNGLCAPVKRKRKFYAIGK